MHVVNTVRSVEICSQYMSAITKHFILVYNKINFDCNGSWFAEFLRNSHSFCLTSPLKFFILDHLQYENEKKYRREFENRKQSETHENADHSNSPMLCTNKMINIYCRNMWVL